MDKSDKSSLSKTREQLENEIKQLHNKVKTLEAQIATQDHIELDPKRGEEFLQFVLTSSQIGIWEWNIETGNIYWSDNVEQIFRLEPNTFDGTYETYLELIHPDDKERVTKTINKVFEDPAMQNRYRIEHRFFARNGTICWLEGRGRLLRDKNNTPIRLIGVVTDITSRKIFEDKLRLSEERYRLLAQNLPNCAIIIYDHDLRFLLVDGPESEKTGYNRETMEGKTLHEALPAEFVEIVENNMRAALDGHFFSAVFPWEENQYYLYAYVPLRDEDAKVEMAMIVAQNITELKHAELALEKSESRYRLLLEQAPDGIFIANTDGNLEIANTAACNLLGYSAEKILRLNIRSIIEEQGLEQLARLKNKSGVNSIIFENRTYRKDNSSFDAELSVRVMEDRRLQIIIRDITDRKKAEAQRLELNIEKSRVEWLEDLISDLSHDLKTPLTSIGTFLYLLNKQTDPTKKEYYVKRLEFQVSHLTHLIEDILTISRLDRETKPKTKSVDLQKLIQQIIIRIQSLTDQRNIHIELEFDNAVGELLLDELEFDRALTNIIENAIVYTSVGGNIRVTTTLSNNEVIIQIEDTGIGIKSEYLPHIFDRFYRVDKSRNTETGGTGLGLAIAKKVVELHEGRIEVNSEVGRGSVFKIFVPISVQSNINT